ncbi:MAG TPA: STAS domain-containing protein [Candidatus Acidoferrales bacterium]|nr:STAS domain-containing protein [Candidatus Acidoferrales bacterium]
MSSDSSVAVIALSGELDVGRSDEVARALELPSGATPVLLDLSDVSYADSTVISALFGFSERAAAANARIAILIVKPQLVRLLEYAGLGEAFPVFRERSAALTYLLRNG